ncbi:MAG: peptidase M14 [Saprospiraceae bacterium]|nr:MAG: peptidase M14 [Saprospiraceae bacterium]
MNKIYLLFVVIFLSVGCKSWQATTLKFPDPVDTVDVPVQMQERKTWIIDGVSADNRFLTAHLNDFQQENDSTFRAIISPENEPINPSPWYAFKLWSTEERKIDLVLDYENAKQRYFPKISYNGRDWQPLDSSLFSIEDKKNARLKLALSSDTLWLAGQVPVSSQDVADWCRKLDQHPEVQWSTYGKSKLNRDLWMLNLGAGSDKGKPTIVLLCRQHPPEVTGWEALKPFVETILADTEIARRFRAQYRVLLFPLLNPDGVDLGFWRHNAGGIDLNRDWAYYRQPEIRQTADCIVNEVKKNRGTVVMGLDFHSTYKDVYYTNEEDLLRPALKGFKDKWLGEIKATLPDFSFRESSSNLGKPVSKSWFLTQFGAIGITYEIGDDTPQEVIRQKGRVSAEKMMGLLLGWD